MKYEFDYAQLSIRVRTKRLIEERDGLRAVAKKTKTSAATLSRLENKRMVDIETLIKVCNWLGESPSSFFKIKSKKKL